MSSIVGWITGFEGVDGASLVLFLSLLWLSLPEALPEGMSPVVSEMFEVYAEAVTTSYALNNMLHPLMHSSIPGDSSDLDFPVFVMNLPRYKRRKAHIQTILGKIGFTNVSYPRITPYRELDFENLQKNGKYNDKFGYFNKRKIKYGADGHKPYVATTLDHVAVMSAAVDNGIPLFGVFEDDLIPGSNYVETRAQILRTLQELPATADMLKLEYCYERCSTLSFSEDHPHLLRATQPFCAAATIFTLKGAQRALEMMQPVWGPIDQMHSSLTMAGELETYLAHPPPLWQDFGMGSETKGRAMDDGHKIQNVLCRELIALQAEDFELSFVGLTDVPRKGIQKVFVPGNLLHRHLWPTLGNGQTVKYTTWSTDASNSLTDVGQWDADDAIPQMLTLEIPRASKCYEQRSCEVFMALHNNIGPEEIGSSFRILFLASATLSDMQLGAPLEPVVPSDPTPGSPATELEAQALHLDNDLLATGSSPSVQRF